MLKCNFHSLMHVICSHFYNLLWGMQLTLNLSLDTNFSSSTSKYEMKFIQSNHGRSKHRTFHLSSFHHDELLYFDAQTAMLPSSTGWPKMNPNLSPAIWKTNTWRASHGFQRRPTPGKHMERIGDCKLLIRKDNSHPHRSNLIAFYMNYINPPPHIPLLTFV